MDASPLQIGKYSVIAELGNGGMADVYLAVTQGPAGFRKLLVLKLVRSALADDPEFVTMFLDEARLAARLNHPNVVQTYEVGEELQRHFIAMEYLAGQPLHRILRHSQADPALPFNARAQYAVLSDVLSGLHHAHELRDFDGQPLLVVHRDVSPQNIFVTYDGQTKVVDFGIAKAVGRSSAATAQGNIKGKINYMAPEQALGTEVDRRADVFAVGVMLWKAATGHSIWEGKDEVGVLSAFLQKAVPNSPREAGFDVPPEVDAICRKALAYDAADRYASATLMQADLDAYLSATGGKLHARDVANVLDGMFAKEKERVRRTIESQMNKLNSALAEPYRLASMTPEASTASLIKARLSSPDTDSVDTVLASMPVAAAVAGADEATKFAALLAVDTPSAPSSVPVARRSSHVVVAIGALVAMFAVVVVGYARHGSLAQTTPRGVATAATASAAPVVIQAAQIGSAPSMSAVLDVAHAPAPAVRAPAGAARPRPAASTPAISQQGRQGESPVLAPQRTPEADDGLSSRK